MERRKFLQNSSAVAVGALAAPYIMKGERLFDVKPMEKLLSAADDNILIILEMFGGNDGLNTILPYHQEEEYMKLRPQLNIPPDFAYQYGSSNLYMHYGLVDDVVNNGLLGLMDQGRLAIVQGVGYPEPNLSHFRSQEIWLSGIVDSDPKVKLLEGWLGRYFAHKLPNFPEVVPDHPLAVQLGSNLSLLFKSNKGHTGIALGKPDDFFNLGQGLTPKMGLYPQPISSFHQKEFNFVHAIAKQSELYANAIKDAYDSGISKIKVEYSGTLGEQMRTISALIAGGLKSKVYYVNISNFDSHAQQANADYKGQHYLLMNSVAKAISEFLEDARQIGYAERVVGMTISEFGRRAYENASRGTDHGAASMQFVFGGSDDFINGGYYAEPGKPDLFDLDQFGNVKRDYDFQRIYADFLQNWFGATNEDISTIFGNYYLPIGLINQRQSSIDKCIVSNGEGYLRVYPNPATTNSNISFELRGSARIDLSIFSISGTKAISVCNGLYDAGQYNYKVDIAEKGAYLAVLTVNGQKFVEKLIVQ